MNKLLVAMVVVVLGVGVGWYLVKGGKPAEEKMAPAEDVSQTSPAPETIGIEETVTSDNNVPGEAMEKIVVKYSDNGFVPVSVAVKAGTEVSFVNESASGMWVASAVHPTHQLLPGFDQLTSSTKGTSYEYAFTKVGTWKYHNHVAPSFTGTVVVTE